MTKGAARAPSTRLRRSIFGSVSVRTPAIARDPMVVPPDCFFAAAKEAALVRQLHWIARCGQGVIGFDHGSNRPPRHAHPTLHGGVFAILGPDPYGLKSAGSLSALIMVSTMSAAPWSSRSSNSSHILRRLARIGAFSDGSRSIRVRAMQKAMASVPIFDCSMEGLLMAGSLSDRY